ncbi:MAG: ABC transporter substrate-binding protein [Fibromonadaceae bacterium]|jgi:microcin C transport system substrate-binding protein|nr:ABC transporter substrate-binding protein [Fibromonadaceae bacterium]
MRVLQLFTVVIMGLSIFSQAGVWVRVNQAGYVPERAKTAVVLSNTDIAGESWSLKNGGTEVLSGQLAAGKPGDDFYVAQAYTYTIDFSSLKEIGIYALELAGAQTQQVLIREDPYSLFATQALMHLRAMRSGGQARLRKPSHLGDSAAIVHIVKGDWEQGAWEEAAPRRTVDMQGGHYDAGDYIKFTLNEAYLAWHLLTAYQENPSLFVKVQSYSDLPDILDEAKYSLDYLLKTFPDENTFVIQVGDGNDHKQGWRMPNMDALEGKRPALCALSRVHMGSTAAALALGAQVFKTLDANAAALYEEKAKAIYARARQSDTQRSAFERDQTNDFYFDQTDTDNMALAAAELYHLTQEQSYLEHYAPPAGYEVSWGSWNAFANHRLAQSGDEAAMARLLTEIGRYERDNVWNLPGEYIWGSLHRWIGAANAHLRARRLQGTEELTAPFLGVLDYAFGRNNWGIAMIASADLPYSIRNIYNGIYRLTEAFPVGALSEGPGDRKTHNEMSQYFTVPANSPFEEFNTSAGVFYDNANDFMIQESTIGGQGDFILMLALASAKNLSPAPDSGTVPTSLYQPDKEIPLQASDLSWITYDDKSEGGNSEVTTPISFGTNVLATLDTRANSTLGYAYSGLKGTFPNTFLLDEAHGIRLVMDLPEGMVVRFNLVQDDITNYAYHGKQILGKGQGEYWIEFSAVSPAFSPSRELDVSKVREIEFVNQVPGQEIAIRIESVIAYSYNEQPPYIPTAILPPKVVSRGPVSLFVNRVNDLFFFTPSQFCKAESLTVLNVQGRHIATLYRNSRNQFIWNARHVSSGVYQIRPSDGSQVITVRKQVFFYISAMRKLLLVCFLLFFSSCVEKKSSIKPLAVCPETPPSYEDATGEFDPIAVPSEAVRCGDITLWGSAAPFSLNMWQDYNSFSVSIMSMLFEPLAELHSTENRPVGILAANWEIAPDGMSYSFEIDSRARWSDGKPVTAYDIQFYYDVIMDPKNLTPIFKVGLSRLERPEVTDSLNFTISAKDSHWANFWTAAGMVAFPKHIWENVDFNSIRFDFPVVSGPYAIRQMRMDRSLELVRREDWWGREKKYNAGKYNFDKITYRFMGDRNKALEALKKGDFDAYPIYTSSIWMKQTDFDAVKKGYVLKNRVFNEEPKGFQGFALNLRRDKFKDLRVRQALSLLLNRELMNDKFMFNEYFLLNTYYPSLWPQHKNPNAPLYPYAPDSARQLLQEAGYTVNAQGKLIDADGKLFELTFLTYMEDIRHTTKFQEDLRAVGIGSKIEKVSLSTFRQRIDDADFDLCWLAWGAGRLSDPEASWHSRTANDKATNNVSGLQDSIVDSLIELQKTEQDLNARNEILRKLDTRLTEIVPNILLWQSDNNKILHWNRFGHPKSLYGKFNREEAIPIYWWYSPEKAKKLQKAQKSGEKLQIPEIDVGK